MTPSFTVAVPANPYLVCATCGERVEGFRDDRENHPCGHLGYRDLCPSWSPVDGCQCHLHLGHRPHGDPAPASTHFGASQGPT